MKPPVASHTFLADWDNCPHKAARKYIIKDLPRGEQTDAMRWGDEVHKAFEARLNERGNFPKGMEKYEAIAKPLADVGARGEWMLGMRKDGTHCQFFANDVWLRGKIDATIFATDQHAGDYAAAIFDWKTGKKREDPSELKVHAVLLQAYKPSIIHVTARYVWLQEHEVGKPHHITANDMANKLADIRSTMNAVENSIATNFFPKRQNPLCGWCPVKDCQFNPDYKRG